MRARQVLFAKRSRRSLQTDIGSARGADYLLEQRHFFCCVPLEERLPSRQLLRVLRRVRGCTCSESSKTVVMVRNSLTFTCLCNIYCFLCFRSIALHYVRREHQPNSLGFRTCIFREGPVIVERPLLREGSGYHILEQVLPHNPRSIV